MKTTTKKSKSLKKEHVQTVQIISTWTGNKYPVTMSSPMVGDDGDLSGYIVFGYVKSATSTHYFSAYGEDPSQALINGLVEARKAILQPERRNVLKHRAAKVRYRDFTLAGLPETLWLHAAYAGFRPPSFGPSANRMAL